jgi:DNA polymerase I-like protein with 3'-5' exonuclease and polymerase domains
MDVASFLSAPTPDVYHTLPKVVLDLETTNILFGDSTLDDNDIVMASILWPNGELQSIWSGWVEFPSEIIDRLQDGEHVLVGQNIKFDLRWLAKAGLDLSKVLVWDTMLAEKVGLGNNPGNLPLNLGSIAERRGMQGKEPVVDKMIKSGVCPSIIPKSLLQRRCEYDVLVTNEVAKQQLVELTANNKLGVVLTRCLLTPVLADIETNGLFLDKEQVYVEYNKTASEYCDVALELSKIHDINWNSPKQKGEALYDWYKVKEIMIFGKPLRTDKGGRKTDIDTLKKLKLTTKIQKRVVALLLKQADLNAKLTKSLSKFKACVDNDDLLYATFNQHIAVTHRLTSNGTVYRTQLQNLARIYKKLFTCRHEGWEFCEADGSGLEFRVAVELGDDEQGRKDLADPLFDPHTMSASIIKNIDYKTLFDRVEEGEAEAKEIRTLSKRFTFKPLFAGESGTKEEQAYYTSFKERYAGITSVQQRWMDEALVKKSVALPWGMEFFFPHTKMSGEGYQSYKTNICNYPVQSFATADIIPIAITYTWHEMKQHKLRGYIANTVHDSVEIEAPSEEKEKINEILKESFTKVCYTYIKEVYKMNFKTPLGVGIVWGSHWGVGKESEFTIPNENVAEEN